MRFRLDPRQRTDDRARFAWMEEVAEAVTREAASRGLAEEEVYFLGVALREALCNALHHGRDHRGEPRVSVSLACRCGRDLVVTIRDHGPGFDPKRVPDPLSPECRERAGGRGLFFMRRFTDRLSFVFPGPGGSLVRLEKRLPVSARRAPARRARGRRPASR
jgi:serine/threonine-protein kinase RsbW